MHTSARIPLVSLYGFGMPCTSPVSEIITESQTLGSIGNSGTPMLYGSMAYYSASVAPQTSFSGGAHATDRTNPNAIPNFDSSLQLHQNQLSSECWSKDTDEKRLKQSSAPVKSRGGHAIKPNEPSVILKERTHEPLEFPSNPRTSDAPDRRTGDKGSDKGTRRRKADKHLVKEILDPSFDNSAEYSTRRQPFEMSVDTQLPGLRHPESMLTNGNNAAATRLRDKNYAEISLSQDVSQKKSESFRLRSTEEESEDVVKIILQQGDERPIRSNQKYDMSMFLENADLFESGQSGYPSRALTSPVRLSRKIHANSAPSTERRAPTTKRQTPSIPSSKAAPKHFENPEHDFKNAMQQIKGADSWDVKCTAIETLRLILVANPTVAIHIIHDLTLIIVGEVNNLRSTVAKKAIAVVTEMFVCMGKGMDAEVDFILHALLRKLGESKEFLVEEVEKALDAVCQNATMIRALNAFMGNADHKNPAVRTKCSIYIAKLIVSMSDQQVTRYCQSFEIDKALPVFVHLLRDGTLETRTSAKKSLCHLSTKYPEFDKLVDKTLSMRHSEEVKQAIQSYASQSGSNLSISTSKSRLVSTQELLDSGTFFLAPDRF